MSIIVRRLNDFIKFKNLSIRKFEMEVGMSNGSLSKAIKNDTDIQTKFLENIFDKYPEINPSWLLTGSGHMTVTLDTLNEPEEVYFKPDKNERLSKILSLPSKTEEEHILKTEVLKLRENLERARNANAEKLLKALKELLAKQNLQ